MSKISLEPNASGAGTFTLAAPDSNTNRTLTLPDEAGVVLTDISDIESQVKTATNATGSAPVYACRAWVNFDGTNTTIRGSGNVSSITDIGTGQYAVNFTTAMPDNDYSVVSGPIRQSGINVTVSTFEALTTSSVEIRVILQGSSYTSVDTVCVAIFR